MNFGDEIVIRDHSNPNHLTMDAQGRIWLSAAVESGPATRRRFVARAANTSTAKADPIDESTRHVALYDPKTDKFTLIQTCFRTHHVQFAIDGTNRLLSNPLGGGRCELRLARRRLSGQDRRPAGRPGLVSSVFRRGRRRTSPTAIGPFPEDLTASFRARLTGVYRGAVTSTPSHLVKYQSSGSNPPDTCVGEMYEVPFEPVTSKSPRSAFRLSSKGYRCRQQMASYGPASPAAVTSPASIAGSARC